MHAIDTPEEAPVLTPAERKELRARAHHLDPVVMIGDAGLTEAVLAEVRRALEVHELIKIRVLGDDRELRQSMMLHLCKSLGCAPVQMIGKLLIVFRPRPPEVSRRPRGPYVPKKAAASGKSVAPRRRSSAAKSGARPATEPAPRARIWLTEASGRPSTRSARGERAEPRKQRAGGRRSEASSRTLAPRGGRAAPAAQGPSRVQGRAGARTTGTRDRSRKR